MSATNHPDWMKRIGATPGKLALIGILAVVLVYVVLSQLPSGKPSTAKSAAPARKLPRRDVKPEAKKNDASVAERQAWPQPDLNQAVATDPFARPPWARPAPEPPTQVAAERATVETGESQALAKLRAEGAAVIVVLDGKPLALIGDRRVRIGDRLEGFYVQDITEAGIVLGSENVSQ